ncbi:outer membrane protein, cobalt-zinc-cadmium efflux system [Pseudarcicella hirudinis]|uniref:Outer membrane protein, cobalt-zinc-cadmium efflux system n=1 Tax=Pseudarcicella hirudinis TaxID=1079859 RepID=A0A1I5YMY5_9BACT|nr:TolC family protein [Pseudarcicella hirudinis]SFQ45608.1 outer membrane protein, cobalt-zinc-cadmium efflux system [Pseudarcicella hirudinis]
MMKYCYTKLLFVFLLWLISTKTFSQVDTSFRQKKIKFSDYLSLVGKNNLSYIAQKFNVNIAEAGLETAKIFPDPQLDFGWFDNGQRRMNMGYGFNSGISWTLELGGKRKARIDLAKSETELNKFLLQDYFRNLRANATLDYLAALQNRLLLEVTLNSYKSMNDLAKSDSIRSKLGAITKVDAKQSKLEAGTMLNNVFLMEAQWKASLANLSQQLGARQTDSLFAPLGDFSGFNRNFSLTELILTAKNNRADLLAALQNKYVSQNLIKLAKANRVMDLALGTGITYASYDRNIIAPTPSFTQINAGISIPLKFSNNHPGELKAAYYNSLQIEVQYQQIELQIQNEVKQAYYHYSSAQKQVQQFHTGLLDEAKAILDGKTYSYQRGEINLLEVLIAQRTYNEVQQNYYQTLYNYSAALVELERAAGIWDINF